MHSLHAHARRSFLIATVLATTLAGPSAANAEDPGTDTDGDGLPDAWEIANFGNIAAQDQFGDPDGDGMNNLQELTSGTDPLTYDGPTAPTPSSPMCATTIASLQPALTVNNAMDPQGTPLLYEFQLYSDFFLTVLVAGTPNPPLVPQGAGATTTWLVPVNLLENNRYYWRARARDQFTFGPFGQACSFFVNTVNDAPGIPHLASPALGARVNTLAPTLRVDDATDPDPGDVLRYQFEVFSDPGLIDLVAQTPPAGVAEGILLTSWQVTALLMEDHSYYWRARACDPGALCSGWSATGQFFVNTINEAPSIPHLASPAFGGQVNTLTPTLGVDNSTDPDPGDVPRYQFEVFSDPGLIDPVAQTPPAGVAEGMPLTSWQVTALLTEDHFYYWRARACGPDNLCSDWSAPGLFKVNTANVPPDPPSIVSPENGTIVGELRPDLVVMNANDADLDALVYDWDLAHDDAFSLILLSGVDDSPQDGRFHLPEDLMEDTRYCWRIRSDDGQATSAYAFTCFFVSEHNDPPSTPVPVSPSHTDGDSSSTPVFSWLPSMDPENDLVTYDLEVIDAAGTVVARVRGLAVAVTPIDQPLEEGATYTWRVRATDDRGASSELSPEESFTVRAPEDGQVEGGGCRAASDRGPGAGMGVGLALGLLACVGRRRRTSPRKPSMSSSSSSSTKPRSASNTRRTRLGGDPARRVLVRCRQMSASPGKRAMGAGAQAE